ncbi:MAG: hypothetical protein HYW85_01730, partial [Deltaproteobacteria bacterium]|nr:hypothetical protein [Deltaproteobacteria bacterium]
MFQKAQAWTGNLNVISDNDSLNQNWSVPKYPRLVIALGLLQPELAGKYATYSFDFFLKERPDLDIRVLLAATNKEIVEELQDPKTIGIIFISHNFKTSLGSAALMDASASPLPSNILSAATPALRFAAFIGCHGPDIQKHYQVKYELSRLEGHQKVYTPESSV